MKITVATGQARIEYDSGEWIVTVEDWVDSGTIRHTVSKRHESGRLELQGVVFVDHCSECKRLARQVIAQQCPPAILADWIEDHPEWWRAPGKVRDAAAVLICERLRSI